ncbi:hypothetical protein RSAG8_04526, partial [Rhizoctonia solani AG-8 WAC10335]
MSDEQIEGWKVMLERDTRRQTKIRQKHEFKGNQTFLPPTHQVDASRGWICSFTLFCGSTDNHLFMGWRGRGGGRGR